MKPPIHFCVCHGIPINKNWKKRITCKKIRLDTLLHKLKTNKVSDLVVVSFLECIASRIWQKEILSQICLVPFSNFGNWITCGPLRIRCIFCIWTTLLIIVHTFAVAIISLHIRKYAILLHLAWLNCKNMSFALFLLYSHIGWIASLVRCLLLRYSVLRTVHRQHRITMMQQ